MPRSTEKLLVFKKNIFIGKQFKTEFDGAKYPPNKNAETFSLEKIPNVIKSEVINWSNINESLSQCLSTTSKDLLELFLFYPNVKNILDFFVPHVPKYVLVRLEKTYQGQVAIYNSELERSTVTGVYFGTIALLRVIPKSNNTNLNPPMNATEDEIKRYLLKLGDGCSIETLINWKERKVHQNMIEAIDYIESLPISSDQPIRYDLSTDNNTNNHSNTQINHSQLLVELLRLEFCRKVAKSILQRMDYYQNQNLVTRVSNLGENELREEFNDLLQLFSHPIHPISMLKKLFIRLTEPEEQLKTLVKYRYKGNYQDLEDSSPIYNFFENIASTLNIEIIDGKLLNVIDSSDRKESAKGIDGVILRNKACLSNDSKLVANLENKYFLSIFDNYNSPLPKEKLLCVNEGKYYPGGLFTPSSVTNKQEPQSTKLLHCKCKCGDTSFRLWICKRCFSSVRSADNQMFCNCGSSSKYNLRCLSDDHKNRLRRLLHI